MLLWVDLKGVPSFGEISARLLASLQKDIRPTDAEETHHNWVMAGKRTAEALKAKGYDYRFVFSKATGHCDGKVFQQTLADTLVWVWRGYKPE